MSEFKVDIGHFKMIVDYYDRKCPCWGGKYSCPCPPFVETKNCRCGSVRTLDDPKGQNSRFKTYRINFSLLDKIARNGCKCPKDMGKVCFCKEFLESGKCELNLFELTHGSP